MVTSVMSYSVGHIGFHLRALISEKEGKLWKKEKTRKEVDSDWIGGLGREGTNGSGGDANHDGAVTDESDVGSRSYHLESGNDNDDGDDFI